MTARTKRCAMGLGLVAWASVAFGGMGTLMGYIHAPDAPADARPLWPADVGLAHAADRPTLVVCLHPRCPCSDATLDTLISLLGPTPHVNAYVLFAVPESAGPDWTSTLLISRARGIAGVNVVIDTGGRASARLGARTSGQTFLYDPAGRLIFTGGLTPGRGETGDTDSVHQIATALSGHDIGPGTLTSPVFGCALCRPTTTAEAVQ